MAQTILGSFLAGLLHIETVLLKYCPANSKDLHDLVLRDFVGDTQLTNEEIQQHLPEVLSENWYGWLSLVVNWNLSLLSLVYLYSLSKIRSKVQIRVISFQITHGSNATDWGFLCKLSWLK